MAIIEKFFVDVLAKKSPRVIIVAPPQHGKSEIVSRKFPSWGMGRAPDLHWMGCSYNQTWADDLCRDVQQVMESPEYGEIFSGVPGSHKVGIPPKGATNLSKKRVADYFELVGHQGRYKAVGRGGGATGRSAHVLIIDDPFKDAAEATSETIRAGAWEWYTQALRTRVQKGGGILIMHTRWHEDDLAGKCIEQARKTDSDFKDDWKVYVFPALADEETDWKVNHWRKPNDALCPNRFEYRDLRMLQSTMSPASWAALYQGSPVALAGNIFDATRWQYYSVPPDWRDFDLVVGTVDCSFKDTATSDFVSAQVWGFTGARRFLLDRVCEQMSYPRTKQCIRELKAAWPMMSHILIEDKANGSAVISELQNEISGIFAIDPAGGKIARAWAASGDQASGNCYLPESGVEFARPDGTKWTATWTTGFVTLFKKFPNVANDDDVDATTQVLNWARNNGLGLIGIWKQQAEDLRAKLGPATSAIAVGQAQKAMADEKFSGLFNRSPVAAKPKPPAAEPAGCRKCENKFLSTWGEGQRCNVCGWKSSDPQ